MCRLRRSGDGLNPGCGWRLLPRPDAQASMTLVLGAEGHPGEPPSRRSAGSSMHCREQPWDAAPCPGPLGMFICRLSTEGATEASASLCHGPSCSPSGSRGGPGVRGAGPFTKAMKRGRCSLARNSWPLPDRQDWPAGGRCVCAGSDLPVPPRTAIAGGLQPS